MKINNNDRGFTFFELCVALCIMLLMLTLGIPGFQSFFHRMELKNGVRTVTVGLSTARYKAVMKNKSVKFCIEDNRVVLKEKRSEKWEEFLHFDLDEKVTVSINSSPVFTPLGTVAPLCSIYVKNEVTQYKITLSIAGRIKVTEIRT